MSQEACLTDIPSDIVIEIFSRLPIKTILSCKSVCKSWLNLLASPEFVQCHLSKSNLPALVFSSFECDRNNPPFYHVVEFETYPTFTVTGHVEFIGCRKKTYMSIECSVNGLMFCCMTQSRFSYSYYICNPITREYIEVPLPCERSLVYGGCYGFGVSKISGQYKIVMISLDVDYELTWEVYSLGTGSWRTIPFECDEPPFGLDPLPEFGPGVFLNGNLHWLTTDSADRYFILCLDLETELFSTFSAPVESIALNLIASDDCLRLIVRESKHLVVWSMKEYGVNESWTKEYVINTTWYSDDGQSYTAIDVINVFSYGDVVLYNYRLQSPHLLYYSSKTETGRVMCISELPGLEARYKGMLHSPSFVSLKSLAMEGVKLF